MQSTPELAKQASWWESAWKSWESFWFRPSSPLTLCFMRIIAGFVFFYVHLNYSFGLQSFVSQDAWVDIETINQARHRMPYYSPSTTWNDTNSTAIAYGWNVFSIYFHVADPVGVTVVHTLIMLAMFCFMIGFCTRVAAPLSWLGAISYVQRAPTTYFGMDTIIVVVFFYMMFAPCGATLSVDRWIEKWRARKRGEAPPPVKATASATFATRLLQIHFCFVYSASGLSKLLGAAWWTGRAVWLTMVNYYFSPMNWPSYMWFVRLMSKNRVIWETWIFLGAYFTLFLEISFVFLIWNRRWRPILIAGSIVLHINICLIMGLATFSATMLSFVLCFFPPATIQGFLDSWGRRLQRWKESAFQKGAAEQPTQKELASVASD